MKKTVIIIVNIIIMVAILAFVVLYSDSESKDSYQRQIEHFEDTTVTMEHVTENYLEGEQRLCDTWARYINNKSMTMEEAAEYIRSSHVLENTSAHLVSLDTLTGISTRPKQGTDDDYAVSYKKVGLLEGTDWIDEIGKSINITRAYTNPMNGEQSLAFCDLVELRVPGSETSETAVLLRVIPISMLEQKWVFPQTELANAEIAMIDANGDYIGIGDTSWEAALRLAYGDHFINMRTYLIQNGLKDLGLVPTLEDLENYRIGRISKRLRSDWTHLNSKGYYSKGKGIYLKGVELGYWS